MNDDAIDVEHTPLALAVAKPMQPAAPVPRYFQDRSPAEQVAYATEVADALKPIIIAKKLAHKLNSRNPDDEYVELEGWQTCGKLCGMSAKIEWVKPVDRGFEARAVVVRVDTGLEIGSGESRCTKAESKWSSRDDYALSGMAQTRALSRALRSQLSWILVLAGYKPTPSEEMPPPEPSRPPRAPQDDPDAALEEYAQLQAETERGRESVQKLRGILHIDESHAHEIAMAFFGQPSTKAEPPTGKPLNLAQLKRLHHLYQVYAKDRDEDPQGMAESFELWLEQMMGKDEGR